MPPPLPTTLPPPSVPLVDEQRLVTLPWWNALASLWRSLSAMLDSAFGYLPGSLLYRDNAAWTALAPGELGQLLASGGAAAPSWIAPPVAPVSGVTAVNAGSGINTDQSGGAVTVNASWGNPSALVGLSAVNGVALASLRADSAPALDVSISPTWTGQHTHTVHGVILGAATGGDQGVGTVNGTGRHYVNGQLPAAVGATPANPAATTSLTGVMMGVAVAITPQVTGTIKIDVTGLMTNDTSGDGIFTQIKTGTGTAPLNGVAVTGTSRGALGGCGQIPFINKTIPFALTALVTGAAIGTALWIDLSLAAATGGSAKLTNIAVTAVEVG